MLSLIRVAAFLLLCCLALPAHAQNSSYSTQLLAAINAFRAGEGLQPLSRNPQLDRVSQRHSDYMIRADFVGHVGPNGQDLTLRTEASGYDYRLLAENIAAGPDSPEAVLAAWLDSAPHAYNLRLAEATEIGLGYNSGEVVLEEGIASDVWTVILATPASGQEAAEAPSEATSPEVVIVLQPTYDPTSNLKPRGRAQGTP